MEPDAKVQLGKQLNTSLRRAKEMWEEILRLRGRLAMAGEDLSRVVSEHNQSRQALFLLELEVRGLTWCTLCVNWCTSSIKVLPVEETELVLIEGVKEDRYGYGRACFEYKRFSQLHRICTSCRESAYSRHGSLGSYRTLETKDEESFFAFRVEMREGVLCACRFGVWQKLDMENYSFAPPRIPEPLAVEYGLPPALSFALRERFVVHEPPAAVSAAVG